MRERTILFVDDEAKARKYFPKMVGSEFEVVLAADGAEALGLFKARQHEIGVVVTDHTMPRMTGLDLLREIRKVNPEVIRVLSTAHADSDLVTEAIANRLLDYFVVKPWDIGPLRELMEKAVGPDGREPGPADEGHD